MYALIMLVWGSQWDWMQICCSSQWESQFRVGWGELKNRTKHQEENDLFSAQIYPPAAALPFGLLLLCMLTRNRKSGSGGVPHSTCIDRKMSPLTATRRRSAIEPWLLLKQTHALISSTYLPLAPELTSLSRILIPPTCSHSVVLLYNAPFTLVAIPLAAWRHTCSIYIRCAPYIHTTTRRSKRRHHVSKYVSN